MLRLEVIRRDRLDREKLKVMKEQIKTRKRKREGEDGCDHTKDYRTKRVAKK